MQGKNVTEAKASEYDRRIHEELLLRMKVGLETLKQIHVVAAPTETAFGIAAQRLLGNRKLTGLRGVASNNMKDLNAVPEMSGVSKLLGGNLLKHPYLLGLIAKAYLQARDEAAKRGVVLKLDDFMKEQGIQLSADIMAKLSTVHLLDRAA